MIKNVPRFLPRLLDKITNTDTPNNSEFTYYGYHVTMLSGMQDYTNVEIKDKKNKTILHFDLDFLTLECVLESYDSYELRDALIDAIKQLYGNKMHFFDPTIEDELERLKPLLGDEEYVQEIVQKEYDELVKHKID